MSAFGKKLRKLGGGRVAFWCPGCQDTHTVGIEAPESYVWGFNGNGDAPTFTPSVLIRAGHFAYDTPQEHCWCNFAERFPEHAARSKAQGHRLPVCYVCHSFVTDGRIQFLPDCTHALAGQTVDLPDFPGAQDE